MWYISDMKARARGILSQNYWMGFVAVIIASAISGAIYGVFQIILQIAYIPSMLMVEYARSYETSMQAIASVGIVMLISIIASYALEGLVVQPIMTGVSKYYLNLRYQKTDLGAIFSVFSRNYGNLAKTQILRLLYTTLWSLLFVIPGIYKQFEYAMIPYLLAENPNLGSKRAFELSKLMMQGEKLHLFGLRLSFIGWQLLGMLACFIGIIFVSPYIYAAEAEVYAALRDKLFYYGYSGPDELPGIPM